MGNPRRRAGLAFLALSLAAPLPGRGAPVPPPAFPVAEQPWCLQLHIHGPLSEQNGSLDWHVDRARAIGVDVLWWTDHDWRTDLLGYTTRFDFENCAWDATLRKWVEPDGYEYRYMETAYAVPYSQASVSGARAYEGTKSFRLQVQDVAGSGFQRIEVAQTTSRRQNVYPLVTAPRLRLAVYPEEFDPAGDKLVIQVRLCEKADGWPMLRYVAGSLEEEPADAIPVDCPAGQWTVLDLDVTADTWARFASGGADSIRAQDNNLFDVRVALYTRDGRTAVAFVDELRYVADTSLAGTGMLDWQRAAGAYYEARTQEVRHFVGSELSRFKIQQHMNAYAPGFVPVDYTGRVASDSLWYAVDQVHAQGGLVSFNHPWGVGIYGNPQETPEMKALRILKAKNDALATELYRCDMLEVGYRIRHGINLAGHLDLWDCLTANGRFVTGTGVTDTHGTAWSIGWVPWQPSALYENNFVTWVWAEAPEERPLLDALAAGRAWFGDPYRWRGEMDLRTIDGFPMGRVVLTDAPSHDMIVRITEAPDGGEVRVRQGRIDDTGAPSTTVSWLREESLALPAGGGEFCDTLTVDASVSSFVRVELYGPDAKPDAFSNPLCLVRQMPERGIRAARAGASLGGMRLSEAAGLLLRAASFDGIAGQVRFTLDEDVPGLGTLVLDASGFGPPAWVTGAGTWTWDSGILRLVGFTGSGSEVTVAWGGSLDAPPEPDAARRPEFSLRPGANPFRGTLRVHFALPDAAAALLEVLDVHGRRVRIVHDAWTDAGARAVVWDGKDAAGRPAANGVYLLRLRAGGDVRTAKVVKVR